MRMHQGYRKLKVTRGASKLTLPHAETLIWTWIETNMDLGLISLHLFVPYLLSYLSIYPQTLIRCVYQQKLCFCSEAPGERT